MWFDEDINLTVETGPVINVSGTVEFSNIDTVTVHEFEQPIIIQTSEYFAPVQSVNGKIGFVNLTAEDLGISGLDTNTFVNTTGNQTVNGVKNFTSRPTVNGTGVLLSGEAYPSNNPSGYITGVNLSSYITTGQTGAFYPLSNPSGFVTGVDLSALYPRSNPSGFITGVNLSAYVTTGQTGVFYPTSNPSGFITNRNVVFTTGSQIISGSKTFRASRYIFSGADVLFIDNKGISSGYWEFTNRPTVNGTGVLLTGEAYPSNNPSNFISSNPPTGPVPLDLLIKYVTGIDIGITSYEGVFPNIYFTENPVLFISLSYESTGTISINEIAGKNRYLIDLAYRNQTGFGVVFSDQISETGINLNVLAYGKGVNL